MLDDSMSLAASDVEKLSGSINESAPQPSEESSDTKSGMDAKLFRVLSKGPYTPGRILARVIRQRFSTRFFVFTPKRFSLTMSRVNM